MADRFPPKPEEEKKPKEESTFKVPDDPGKSRRTPLPSQRGRGGRGSATIKPQQARSLPRQPRGHQREYSQTDRTSKSSTRSDRSQGGSASSLPGTLHPSRREEAAVSGPDRHKSRPTVGPGRLSTRAERGQGAVPKREKAETGDHKTEEANPFLQLVGDPAEREQKVVQEQKLEVIVADPVILPAPLGDPNPPVQEAEEVLLPAAAGGNLPDLEASSDSDSSTASNNDSEHTGSGSDDNAGSDDNDIPDNNAGIIMAMQGNQLNTIPLYSGNRGLDALDYAEAIDTAIVSFQWTQMQGAQAALGRGGPVVAKWLRGERGTGTTYTAWNGAAGAGVVNMRPAFINRFGLVYTASGAVAAISDLKQRSSESVVEFMDRVKNAVNMLNYNIPEANRDAAFQDMQTRMIIAQFGSGVVDYIRDRIFGTTEPPDTVIELQNMAAAIEAEKQAGKPTKLVGAVEEGEIVETAAPTVDTTAFEELASQVKDVLAITRKSFGRNPRRGGSNGQRPDYSSYKCYNCNQMGHLRRNCTRPQTPFHGGNNRGSVRGFSTRRGRFQQNFGSNRARPFNPSGHGSGFQRRSGTYDIEPGYHPGYDWTNQWGTQSGNEMGEWF